MPKSANPIPPGFHTVTPHISVTKGAAAYIDFLKRAFNAEEIARMPGPGGKIMHAAVRIGDSILMLNDDFSAEFKQPPLAQEGLPLVFHTYVPDADAVFKQATSAGCEVKMPLADQFWGDRYGLVKDPFGFTWGIATHVEDLTPAEMAERQRQAFANFNQ